MPGYATPCEAHSVAAVISMEQIELAPYYTTAKGPTSAADTLNDQDHASTGASLAEAINAHSDTGAQQSPEMSKRLQSVTKKAIGRLKGKKNDRPSSEEEALPRDVGSAYLLALPAELRNRIYEVLAFDTTLVLYPAKRKKPLTPVALLLACHQTRREFKKLLFANAQILINIHEYHFNNLVRVLETIDPEDLEALKLNRSIWILLSIAHVPSKDNRVNLQGWIDYRRSDYARPYFGPNGKAASELVFDYDVRFLPNLRPPRPPSRDNDVYAMKMDLLRAHARMFGPFAQGVGGGRDERQKMRHDIDDCLRLFEERQLELCGPSLRRASYLTIE